MSRHYTFGQRLTAGFIGTCILTLIIAGMSIFALRRVVASKDGVIEVQGRVRLLAEQMNGAAEAKAGMYRGFLLTASPEYLEDARQARQEFQSKSRELRSVIRSDEERRLEQEIQQLEAEHERAIGRAVERRQANASIEEIARIMNDEVAPQRKELQRALGALGEHEKRSLEESVATTNAETQTSINSMIGASIVAVLASLLTASYLSRSLSRQISSAVGRVQSSSAELQAAANQQTTSAREQSTSMSEIATTISELLATSKQIAESSQRVAQIAMQTVSSARVGDGTVNKGQDQIGTTKRQVDAIVAHMLDLGRKSQQIGSVLEIVAELAEQTNILAINATIEAVGAGEAGKRFGVVADEIRKLADRVGGSMKEVRALIDDVRGAVNTTVMATETGSKAADASSRQFTDIAASFKEIVGLVSTTTEAAREIELSTKQQSTAVEQVNLAISNAAQASRETETSSGQTLATASQLATVSKELMMLVQPG